MSLPARAQREDKRREWALWILVAAETSDISATEAAERVAASFVGDRPPITASDRTEFFAVERFEDHLPTPDEWALLGPGVLETITTIQLNRAAIDETIREASPRWRVERMPIIDRSLLRIGVAELRFRSQPRPRATLNGLIELAKRYGESSSPRFVNGILDQIRKNLDIPFT